MIDVYAPANGDPAALRLISGFYPTPVAIVEMMLSRLAPLERDQRVLEPSAGRGDIADRLRAYVDQVTVVEPHPQLAELLAGKGYGPFTGSFETFDPSQAFDRIAMNPPFAGGRDMDHVQRAFGMLAPGGVLVALMNDGAAPGDGTDEQRTAFANWLREVQSIAEVTIEQIDPALLLTAENLRPSRVPVKLVTLRKCKARPPSTTDYDSDLRFLKRSFDGGGEGSFYFRVLERLAERRHLDWLDIGIGRDGGALLPFVAGCRERGQTLAITGIDPDATPGEFEENGVRWRLLRETFQGWRDDGQYDIVNADQALYYLGDTQTAIARILRLLRPGGIFIATCWSRDDALHRLRTRLFTHASDDLVGEEVLALLRRMPGFTHVETTSFENRVRLRAWREDPGFLDAALRVIARRPLDPSTYPQPEALLAVLDDFSDEEQRINVALCATREAP